MEWVQGDRLEEYIQSNLGNANVISLLATNWLKMITTLRQASIAHGDLQHGNILVVNGDFKLIDYDGMFVPSLAGHSSHEMGHSNYQHPKRTPLDFGTELDNFSSWVIYLSLLALKLDSQLWHRIQSAGDDRMLFSKEDFTQPDFSDALRIIGRINNAEIQSLIEAIKGFTRLSSIEQVPPLSDFFRSGQVPESKTHTVSSEWIRDHRQSAKPTPAAPVSKNLDIGDGSWIETHLEPISPVVFNGSLAIERLAFLSLSTAVALCLRYLVVDGSNALYSVATTSVIGGLLCLLLQHRFQKFPKVQIKHKLIEEAQRMDSNIGLLIKVIAERNQQLASLNATEDLQCNALKQKHKALEDCERSEFSVLHQQFITEQGHFANERTRLDSDGLRIEAETRSMIGQSENKEQREKESNQRVLEQKLAEIRSARFQSQQSEDNDVQRALVIEQDAFVQKELNWWSIATESIEQIGQTTKQRLRMNGINTAADIPDFFSSIRIEGITDSRKQRLVDWKNKLKARIRVRAPRSLSAGRENTIRSAAAAYRLTLNANERSVKATAEQRDGEIDKAGRAERASLEVNLRDMKAQLQTARGQLNERDRKAQAAFQQKNESLAMKWRQEKVAVEVESKRTQQQFQPQRNEVETQVAESNKRLSALHWRQNNLKRELAAYRDISWSGYLKAIVLVKR
jgi:hypothetical protein